MEEAPLDVEALDLSSCVNLTGASLSAISSLPSLQHLNLSGTSFNEGDLFGLARARMLRTLVLNHTAVTDAVLSAILPGMELTELSINNTRVTSAALTVIAGNGRAIRELGLNSTKVAGALRSLDKLTHLEVLGLAELDISDEAPLGLLSLRALWNVNVNHSTLSQLALNRICSIRSLRCLSARSVNLDVTAVRKLPMSLQILDAANSVFGDDAAFELSLRTELELLDVTATQITDAGLRALARLPRLRAIAVAGTSATEMTIAELREECPSLMISESFRTKAKTIG